MIGCHPTGGDCEDWSRLTPRLLATTKFSPPAPPSRYVPRPRLHQVLDAAAGLPLTVIVGLPGAGKTVALTTWLADRPELHAVWLSCDARDADPVTFWLALSTALEQTWPEWWVDVADLLSEREPDLDDVVIAVVNGLVELGEPVVLVIDDLHFAAEAAPSLTSLIERLPASCRVVVGSRTEPQLGLHRFRAYGQVREVRDAELRLTPPEVAAVLRAHEVDLDETEVDFLAERTEGWMAGVQMAAVSLRDQPDREVFLAELAKTPRAITDFLGAEVLDCQPSEIRDFLLDTSVLDVLEGGSCAAVTQQHDATATLARLEERNLFTIELGEGAYRYHHLFADLLRQRLRAEEPDREVVLHRRAAVFFLQTGDPENAIVHFLAGGQTAEALDVFRSQLVASFRRGDGRMPRRLVATLEDRSITVDPAYVPDLALALAASAPAAEAEPWLARAGADVDSLGEEGRARLAMAKAVVALQHGEALDIERAFSDYADPTQLPDEELSPFVPGLLARSRLWLGDVHGARSICEQHADPYELPSAHGVSLTSALAWVACVEGHLTEAERLARRAMMNANSIGLTEHPVLAETLFALGRVSFDRGDPTTAEEVFEKAMSTAQYLRPSFELLSQLLLSGVWLAEGRPGEALEGIAQARAFLPPGSTSPLLQLCDALEVRIAIETGDLDRAEHSASRLAPGNRAGISQARLDVARGAFDQAKAAIDRVLPLTLRERLDVAVLEARIAHGRRQADADARLAAVLDLARGERFVILVADEMSELRPRITYLLRSRPVGAFEQSVLDRIELDLTSINAADGGAGPLSDRELTVVRYLASRLTYREIAAEIFVSTNTVKTHGQRIYRKLGVSSRSEAVAEARRLGLL